MQPKMSLSVYSSKRRTLQILIEIPVEKFFENSQFELPKLDTRKALRFVRRAVNWTEQPSAVDSNNVTNIPRLKDVIDCFRKTRFATFARATRVGYEKIFFRQFETITNRQITRIDPKLIDDWLEERKNSIRGKIEKRESFQRELRCLSMLFRFYQDHWEPADFRSPIRKRHKEMALIKLERKQDTKNLTEEEFLKFRKELLKDKRGKTLAVMATIQFYQALRISEVAALHWEDVVFCREEHSNSTINVQRHIEWIRDTCEKDEIVFGLKNSVTQGNSKLLPLYPESFKALKNIYTRKSSGLIFSDKETFFEYRVIQAAYTRAFKRAGLYYRGTHVLRHGGCRKVYNETGDVAIAGQLLGNTSTGSTLVYAKRDKRALKNHFKRAWDVLIEKRETERINGAETT